MSFLMSGLSSLAGAVSGGTSGTETPQQLLNDEQQMEGQQMFVQDQTQKMQTQASETSQIASAYQNIDKEFSDLSQSGNQVDADEAKTASQTTAQA